MAFINSYKAPDTTDSDPEKAAFVDPYDLNSEIPVPPQILETERVQVVPFIPSIHADLFYEAFAKDAPTLEKYFPITWPTLKSFYTSLENLFRRDTSSLLFAIIDKTRPSTDARVPAGRIAGIIGWANASPSNLSLEIGPVIVLPEFQRTFVSANAIGLLLRYVLDLPVEGGLGFRRVKWSASPYNEGSIAAAEKMGFEKEGVAQWLWVLPVGKEGRPVNEERGKGDGRDSVVLALCWDRWTAGVRKMVIKRMERV